jgi:hypothetical protein
VVSEVLVIKSSFAHLPERGQRNVAWRASHFARKENGDLVLGLLVVFDLLPFSKDFVDSLHHSLLVVTESQLSDLVLHGQLHSVFVCMKREIVESLLGIHIFFLEPKILHCEAHAGRVEIQVDEPNHLLSSQGLDVVVLIGQVVAAEVAMSRRPVKVG